MNLTSRSDRSLAPYCAPPCLPVSRHSALQSGSLLKNIVASVFDVRVQDIDCTRRCCSKVALARQVAMYLARTGLGLSLPAVGRLFDRDRTTVSHACQVVEDLRDEARMDFLLGCLERALGEWLILSRTLPEH